MNELTLTQTEYLQWVVARNALNAVLALLLWGMLVVLLYKVRKSSITEDASEIFNKTTLTVLCALACLLVGFFITQNVLGIVKAKTAPRAYLNSYWNTGEIHEVK